MDPGSVPLVVLALATLAGAAVQAATGFGFAILAAPVYLAVLDSTEAVPLLAALHVVQSAMLVPALWSRVPRPDLGRLMLGAAIGCPLGLLLYHALDVRGLKLVAGVVILLATALVYLRSHVRSIPAKHAEGRAPQVATGVVSGVLTALLVMPGPPLMVMLMRRPLPPESARALSLTFFSACYVAVTLMNVAAGSLTRASWGAAALLTGPLVLGTFVGRHIFSVLPPKYFTAVLYVLLVMAGLGAIVSAI